MLALPRECTEAIHDGHLEAFAFFGGVPRRISYDNSRIAVTKITGPHERELTDAFLRLHSHYLFEANICRVASPASRAPDRYVTLTLFTH